MCLHETNTCPHSSLLVHVVNSIRERSDPQTSTNQAPVIVAPKYNTLPRSTREETDVVSGSGTQRRRGYFRTDDVVGDEVLALVEGLYAGLLASIFESKYNDTSTLRHMFMLHLKTSDLAHPRTSKLIVS